MYRIAIVIDFFDDGQLAKDVNCKDFSFAEGGAHFEVCFEKNTLNFGLKKNRP